MDSNKKNDIYVKEIKISTTNKYLQLTEMSLSRPINTRYNFLLACDHDNMHDCQGH